MQIQKIKLRNLWMGILDTLKTHSHNGLPGHLADVAELADAQVSEACDGDIVEVQVLSSAPCLISDKASPNRLALLFGTHPPAPAFD